MSSRKVNIADLLNVAIIAAQSAGAEILTAKNNGTFDTNIKGFVNGDEDFVTSADKAAQCIIIGFLRHYFNDLNIIGEEEDVSYSDTLPAHKKLETIPTDACPCELKHVDKDRVCIFIDPLDATREFVKGDVQCVMCLIGISVDGKPTAGVCFQPFVDRAEQMTWGLCGYGTSLDQNQRGSYAQSLVSHAELTVIYSGRADALTEKAVQLLNPAQVLRASGAGYKTLLLIKQKATVQIATSGTKLWDTCAPHAILSACGGSMTDFNGMAIEYKFNSPLTNGPLIATLGWAHQECISKLSQMTD